MLRVAVAAVERDSSKSGSHFKAGEAFSLRGPLAQFEDAGANTAPGPGGMNEEGADFSGFGFGIEKRVVAVGRWSLP